MPHQARSPKKQARRTNQEVDEESGAPPPLPSLFSASAPALMELPHQRLSPMINERTGSLIPGAGGGAGASWEPLHVGTGTEVAYFMTKDALKNTVTRQQQQTDAGLRKEDYKRTDCLQRAEAVMRRLPKCLGKNDFSEAIRVMETAQNIYRVIDDQSYLDETAALIERAKGDDLAISQGNEALEGRNYDRYILVLRSAREHYRQFAQSEYYARLVANDGTPSATVALATECAEDRLRFERVSFISRKAKESAMRDGTAAVQLAREALALNAHETARSQFRGAVTSFKWVGHDAAEELEHLQRAIEDVARRAGNAVLVQANVRGSFGRRRAELRRMVQIVKAINGERHTNLQRCVGLVDRLLVIIRTSRMWNSQTNIANAVHCLMHTKPLMEGGKCTILETLTQMLDEHAKEALAFEAARKGKARARAKDKEQGGGDAVAPRSDSRGAAPAGAAAAAAAVAVQDEEEDEDEEGGEGEAQREAKAGAAPEEMEPEKTEEAAEEAEQESSPEQLARAAQEGVRRRFALSVMELLSECVAIKHRIRPSAKPKQRPKGVLRGGRNSALGPGRPRLSVLSRQPTTGQFHPPAAAGGMGGPGGASAVGGGAQVATGRRTAAQEAEAQRAYAAKQEAFLPPLHAELARLHPLLLPIVVQCMAGAVADAQKLLGGKDGKDGREAGKKGKEGKDDKGRDGKDDTEHCRRVTAGTMSLLVFFLNFDYSPRPLAASTSPLSPLKGASGFGRGGLAGATEAAGGAGAGGGLGGAAGAGMGGAAQLSPLRSPGKRMPGSAAVGGLAPFSFSGGASEPEATNASVAQAALKHGALHAVMAAYRLGMHMGGAGGEDATTLAGGAHIVSVLLQLSSGELASGAKEAEARRAKAAAGAAKRAQRKKGQRATLETGEAAAAQQGGGGDDSDSDFDEPDDEAEAAPGASMAQVILSEFSRMGGPHAVLSTVLLNPAHSGHTLEGLLLMNQLLRVQTQLVQQAQKEQAAAAARKARAERHFKHREKKKQEQQAEEDSTGPRGAAGAAGPGPAASGAAAEAADPTGEEPPLDHLSADAVFEIAVLAAVETLFDVASDGATGAAGSFSDWEKGEAGGMRALGYVAVSSVNANPGDTPIATEACQLLWALVCASTVRSRKLKSDWENYNVMLAPKPEAAEVAAAQAAAVASEKEADAAVAAAEQAAVDEEASEASEAESDTSSACNTAAPSPWVSPAAPTRGLEGRGSPVGLLQDAPAAFPPPSAPRTGSPPPPPPPAEERRLLPLIESGAVELLVRLNKEVVQTLLKGAGAAGAGGGGGSVPLPAEGGGDGIDRRAGEASRRAGIGGQESVVGILTALRSVNSLGAHQRNWERESQLAVEAAKYGGVRPPDAGDKEAGAILVLATNTLTELIVDFEGFLRLQRANFVTPLCRALVRLNKRPALEKFSASAFAFLWNLGATLAVHQQTDHTGRALVSSLASASAAVPSAASSRRCSAQVPFTYSAGGRVRSSVVGLEAGEATQGTVHGLEALLKGLADELLRERNTAGVSAAQAGPRQNAGAAAAKGLGLSGLAAIAAAGGAGGGGGRRQSQAQMRVTQARRVKQLQKALTLDYTPLVRATLVTMRTRADATSEMQGEGCRALDAFITLSGRCDQRSAVLQLLLEGGAVLVLVRALRQHGGNKALMVPCTSALAKLANMCFSESQGPIGRLALAPADPPVPAAPSGDDGEERQRQATAAALLSVEGKVRTLPPSPMLGLLSPVEKGGEKAEGGEKADGETANGEKAAGADKEKAEKEKAAKAAKSAKADSSPRSTPHDLFALAEQADSDSETNSAGGRSPSPSSQSSYGCSSHSPRGADGSSPGAGDGGAEAPARDCDSLQLNVAAAMGLGTDLIVSLLREWFTSAPFARQALNYLRNATRLSSVRHSELGEGLWAAAAGWGGGAAEEYLRRLDVAGTVGAAPPLELPGGARAEEEQRQPGPGQPPFRALSSPSKCPSRWSPLGGSPAAQADVLLVHSSGAGPFGDEDAPLLRPLPRRSSAAGGADCRAGLSPEGGATAGHGSGSGEADAEGGEATAAQPSRAVRAAPAGAPFQVRGCEAQARPPSTRQPRPSQHSLTTALPAHTYHGPLSTHLPRLSPPQRVCPHLSAAGIVVSVMRRYKKEPVVQMMGAEILASVVLALRTREEVDLVIAKGAVGAMVQVRGSLNAL
jgi:hypothetical protein